MIACVFSCVPLIIHRCCKKPTIIVVSFLFFSFHKDLSTARGALRLLLGSQILLFLFSLPANPPPPCLFFEADVNRCLQRAVYLSLPRLVLSSDPRVNAFQRSIILCFYGLPMEGWKEERERETYRDWEKVENNQTITTYARCCGFHCSIYYFRALTDVFPYMERIGVFVVSFLIPWVYSTGLGTKLGFDKISVCLFFIIICIAFTTLFAFLVLQLVPLMWIFW